VRQPGVGGLHGVDRPAGQRYRSQPRRSGWLLCPCPAAAASGIVGVMGIGKFAKLAKAVIEDQAAQFPKWARIVGLRPERGGFVTLDLEIHYGWAEPFVYSGRYPARALGGVVPEAGRDVAIRRILPYDDEEVTYAIEWGMEPQYGTPADAPPEQRHPALRMAAAKRAYDAGMISDAELEQAKDDLRRWGRGRGVTP
jgi:hypothetical protein